MPKSSRATTTKTSTGKRSPYFKSSSNNKESPLPSNVPEDNAVPDNIDHDLRVLFVGINPGVMSAARGHHFAGPTNHFWPCLSESGLVTKKVTYKDDADLPRLYRKAGIPVLTAKFKEYRPRVACFVGKGIYEIYTGEKCKSMGLQDRTVQWENRKGSTRLFVMPSTSGIVSAYQKADKLKFFQELNEVANRLDKEYQDVEKDR
ncbi:hypothetical protein VTP01DRAFT_7969 [Rhizomucor pusillus]|uniref:uncharacterized protein n=1 Tax=Rhizomucor pusillus TaxID=4840 RepID=UPI0037427C68